jgi:hypothetical protein
LILTTVLLLRVVLLLSSLKDKVCFRLCESYGCRVGIVGGRFVGCGIQGGADRVVRNGRKDGLAASVVFRSMTCPFLYRVKVRLSPADLC